MTENGGSGLGQGVIESKGEIVWASDGLLAGWAVDSGGSGLGKRSPGDRGSVSKKFEMSGDSGLNTPSCAT